MPGFDRTGPEGQGSKTGGGLGRCGSARKRNDPSGGRGLGRGGRFATNDGETLATRGPRGNAAAPNPRNPETETEKLQQEADDLRARLRDIEARLARQGRTAR